MVMDDKDRIVGGFNPIFHFPLPLLCRADTWSQFFSVSTPLKNMKVNRKDDIPYIVENKNMFETTNQVRD
jgi:hypothetical protein